MTVPKTACDISPSSTVEAPQAQAVQYEHSLLSSGKNAAIFAAYLLMAMPYNMAMAADWQTPAQLAALQSSAYATPQQSALTITTAAVESTRYFQISNQDIAREVAAQLVAQGVEEQATATVTNTAESTVYGADHPLKLVIHALQVDPSSGRWQAQANIMNGSTTEAVKPVSGRYEALVNVPVLSRQLGPHDVIAAEDLSSRAIPKRQLRKDTITDTQMLIGQSPRNLISSDRPLRQREVSAPILIKKGSIVDMHYSTPYMTIRTTGIALEDGAAGGTVRVKNEKTEKAISARVVDMGRVEVNSDTTL